MPAPPLANTFEGGTDTTTISAANSGGASGDAFSIVTSDTSGPTYSITQAHRGSLGAKIATAASSPTSVHVEWTGLGSITTSVYFRCYFWLPSSAVSLRLLRVQTAANATCALLGLNSVGTKMASINAAANEQTPGTVSVSFGQWIRIEWRVLASTTVGEMEWRLFNTADSTAADDTVLSTSQVLGANIDRIRVGIPGGTVPTSYTMYYDDIAVSSTDWIGPSTVTPLTNTAFTSFLSRG